MIILSKIFNPEQDTVIGVSIQIGEDHYFIDTDQKHIPGVRTGEFPRYLNVKDGRRHEYPMQKVIEIKCDL